MFFFEKIFGYVKKNHVILRFVLAITTIYYLLISITKMI